MLMQCTRHGHSDWPLTGEYFRHLGTAADEGNQVAGSQTRLVHAELDRGDGAWVVNRYVPVLVRLDQIGQNIEFVPFQACLLGIHQFFNAGKRGRVVSNSR